MTRDEFRALVDQGALAIERVLLVEDMDRVKRTVESDRLRGALLTSISHDLKTPLASVLGAASTMRDLDSGLNDAQKRDLLATVIDESERLNRFIANLLDMTKLESGAIVPNTARHDVSEIVGSAGGSSSTATAGSPAPARRARRAATTEAPAAEAPSTEAAAPEATVEEETNEETKE